MKLPDTCVTLALLVALALPGTEAKKSKYFSQGWQPGQPTHKFARPVPTGNYGRDASGAWKLGELNIPVVQEEKVEQAVVPRQKKPSVVIALTNTLSRLSGFNFTEAYERNKKEETFDRSTDVADGFVRLTDENFEEIVAYEQFPDEYGVTLADRVWFIVIHGPPRDVASKYFVEGVTNATILAHEDTSNSLRNVKWARMDYMAETELTARWLVVKPPVLVVATNRGQDLRFITSGMIAPNGTVIERYMREERWKNLPIWKSQWGPGGSREWVIDFYVYLSKFWAKATARVPGWLLVIITTMATQQILSFLHRNDKPAVKPPVVKKSTVAIKTNEPTVEKIEAKTTATEGKSTKVETRRKGKK